jgi:hypothetical protein
VGRGECATDIEILLYLLIGSRYEPGPAFPLTRRQDDQTSGGRKAVISESGTGRVTLQAIEKHEPECQALIEDLC